MITSLTPWSMHYESGKTLIKNASGNSIAVFDDANDADMVINLIKNNEELISKIQTLIDEMQKVIEP